MLNINRKWVLCSAVIVLVVFFTAFVFGQRKTKTPFAAIPESARPRLIARLKLLIKYQHELRWPNEFDLLSNLYLQGENEEKQKYVKNRKRYFALGYIDRLVDFTPRATTGPPELMDDGEWVIHGCGRWLVKHRIVKYDSSVIAVRQRGDWFFSEVTIVTSVGGPPEPCPN
jgi:hypothetical protein